MEIIPAIDLRHGQCVRLSAGDFARQTPYSDDPLTVARRFADAGLRRLHLVDLDGAKAGRPVNLAILESIAQNTDLDIDFGGGIQDEAAAEAAFAAGAQHLTAGSLAVREPATVQQWLRQWGPERLFIGADFKDDYIMVSAWTEQSTRTLADFVGGYLTDGAHTFICTDVSKDGLLQGPSTAAYQRLREQFPQARFIASGGVTTVADLEQLGALGMHGAIIGKALYEGTIDLADLKAFL